MLIVNNLVGFGVGGADGGYSIPVSGSFNGSVNAILGITSPSSTHTVSCWVKPATVGDTNRFPWSFDLGAGAVGLATRTSTSYAAIYDGSSYNDSNDAISNTSNWYHLCWIATAGSADLFINGTEEISNISLNSIAGATAFSVGDFSNGSNGWSGLIADFVYLDGTAEPVASFYNSGALDPTGLSFGTNGFWCQDLDVGTDISGNGNDLTPDAGITTSADTPTA
ncbi:MAG: LamG-like jellyroll fold domain-containing protein [Rhodospirillales bacterium]